MEGDGEKGAPFYFTKGKRYVLTDLDVVNIFFSKGYAGSGNTL